MSKEFVLGTLHHYDWDQIGGAIKHPENGKRVDMNQDKRRGSWRCTIDNLSSRWLW